MTILEAESFYKQDKNKYELNQNEEFLKWYEEKLSRGYKPLLNIIELQDLINKIAIWYEIKYPEKELEFYEGIADARFLNMKKISKVMNLEQLMYRLSDNQYYLIKCAYRTGLGGCRPICKDGEIVGYDYRIGISIKRKNKQKCESTDYRNLPYFLISANPINGEINTNHELADYVKTDKITIKQLLVLFDNKYKEELDFSELNECIYNYNVDLELRNTILQLAALKLLYSCNTTPLRGYERAKRFINEFNKKLNLKITTEEIDNLIKYNYKKFDIDDNRNPSKKELISKAKRLIKIFSKKTT